MESKIGEIFERHLAMFNGYLSRKFDKQLLKDYGVTLANVAQSGLNDIVLNQIGDGYETKIKLVYQNRSVCEFSYKEFIKFDENGIPCEDFEPEFLKEE